MNIHHIDALIVPQGTRITQDRIAEGRDGVLLSFLAAQYWWPPSLSLYDPLGGNPHGRGKAPHQSQFPPGGETARAGNESSGTWSWCECGWADLHRDD